MKIWFCGFALFLALAGCSTKPKDTTNDSPATPVEVTVAKSATLHHVVSAEAILYAVNQATIVPKISAPVQRFTVQRGDHVKRGQLLAVLEDLDLRALTNESRQLYQQAQANLDNTKAAVMPDDMAKAQSDAATAQEGVEAARRLYYNRVSLFKEGALAQKLVDDAKVALVQAQGQSAVAAQHLKSLQGIGQASQLKAAEAQADAARAHYESSAAQSSYSEVRSPIAGVVADRGVNVGDMANSGSALFTIVDTSHVVARANVPVNEASAIRRGQSATIRSSDQEAKAKVIVVSPTVDPNATTVQVWAEAANNDEALKLGSTVTVLIEAGDVPNAVSVPAAALLASDEGGEKVMVAVAGVAHERKVEVGVHDGDDVQLLSGVQPGESVITRGGLGLDDKAKVKVSNPRAGSEDK